MQCPGIFFFQLVLKLSNYGLVASDYLFIADNILFCHLLFSLQFFELFGYIFHFLVVLFDFVILIMEDHILLSSILLE